MACEHDRIHLETSSVLIRELPLNFLQKPKYWPEPYVNRTRTATSFPPNELLSVNGDQAVVLGKDRKYPSYGWDNEYGRRTVNVKPFKASKDIVTNGEFLEFVKQGGYRERKHWSEDGWGWRRFRNVQHPHFWIRNGPQGSHKYLLRNMFELSPFDLSLPAVVNHHEAKAFCHWKAENAHLPGLRLLTEAEHQLLLDKSVRASQVTPSTDPALLYNGADMDNKAYTNTALAFGSERPVDLHPPNSQGFRDAMGNVWQWCEDHMAPFPGFEAHGYYGDFTEPCFDGRHYVIKGGSFASSGDAGANAHARYHFRPHFLQHSGFRYVLPEGENGGRMILQPNQQETEAKKENKQQTQGDYENESYVKQYLDLHFRQTSQNDIDRTFLTHEGRPDKVLDFPKRCAVLVKESFDAFAEKPSKKSVSRVLDLGCAVGGSSFHLAKLGFDEVVGLDFSKAFIEAANELKSDSQGNSIAGELEHRKKTKFVVGDACNLVVGDLGQFDALLGANLLCRLPQPHACLKQLPKLMKPGGVVVFVSPFSWLESFTPKENWIGEVGNGEKELVMEMTSLGFELKIERDMPLIIKEHRRKYQYIVSHAAVFVNVN